MGKVAVVMDWGGTWVRSGVVDYDGNLLWHDRSLNKSGGTQSELITGAEEILSKALDWCSNRSVAGIGIAAAGPIDADSGIFYSPPNLQVLDGISIKDIWASKIKRPILVGNDATLAALGEYNYGSGLGSDDNIQRSRTLLYLTISTGVGGGVIDRGKMVLGAHGMAAEVGHIRIDSDDCAPICQCGNRGCLEALVSGTSIVNLFNLELKNVKDQVSRSFWDNKTIDAQIILDAAYSGDPVASLVANNLIRNLSDGITSLIHLFNPDLVVLGGGVSLSLTRLGHLEAIQHRVMSTLMSRRHKEFRIVPAKLGDNSGLIGAAHLVWEEYG